MDDTAELLRALNRAKVAFQARTLEMVIYGAVLPPQAASPAPTPPQPSTGELLPSLR